MKNLKLILISALLCVCLLFSSCDSPNLKGPDGPIAQDYAQITASWLKHLAYDGDEKYEAIKEPALLLDYDSYSIEFSEYMLKTCTVEFDYTKIEVVPKENDDDIQLYKTLAKCITSVYNLKDGKNPVYSSSYNITVNVKSIEDITWDDVVSYTVDAPVTKKAVSFVEYYDYNYYTEQFGGMFYERTATTVKGTPTDDEPNPADVTTVSYTVYDSHGKAIKENIPEEDFVAPVASQIKNYGAVSYGNPLGEINFDGLRYFTDNGEIIAKFPKTDGRIIPKTHFEFNGYHYVSYTDYEDFNLDGEEDEKLQIQVFDKDYNLVLEKEITCNDIDWYVLSSGEIFVQYLIPAAKDSEEYDVCTSSEDKYLVENKIISLAGVEKDVESAFIIEGMITKAMPNDTCTVKNGVNFAFGYKINENKQITSETCYFVCDNAIQVTEELAKFAHDQTGYPMFINESSFAVSTRLSGTLLLKSGSAQPTNYVNCFNDSYWLSSYYVINDTLYNSELSVVYNLLKEFDSYTIVPEYDMILAINEYEETDPDTGLPFTRQVENAILINPDNTYTVLYLDESYENNYTYDIFEDEDAFFNRNGFEIKAKYYDTSYSLIEISPEDGIYVIEYQKNYQDYEYDDTRYVEIYR